MMLHKTRGVVFRFTRYGESSIIVNIFTAQFGLQSYIVNGIRSKSPKGKIALFQPLMLLDLVVYHRENANILRIKEAKSLYPYRHLFQDIRRTSVALFIDEVVNKSIKEQSHAEHLCDYLIRALISLDQLEQVENFHLVFMIHLSRHLGFGPQATEEILDGAAPLEADDERVLQTLLRADFTTPVEMSHSQRRTLLDTLVRFYANHVENFGKMRSLGVLREILG